MQCRGSHELGDKTTCRALHLHSRHGAGLSFTLAGSVYDDSGSEVRKSACKVAVYVSHRTKAPALLPPLSKMPVDFSALWNVYFSLQPSMNSSECNTYKTYTHTFTSWLSTCHHETTFCHAVHKHIADALQTFGVCQPLLHSFVAQQHGHSNAYVQAFSHCPRLSSMLGWMNAYSPWKSSCLRTSRSASATVAI